MIRSSSSCATPWAGKAGTGANFVITSGTSYTVIELGEAHARAQNVFVSHNGSFGTTTKGVYLNAEAVKAIGCVAQVDNTHEIQIGIGFDFSSTGDRKLAYACIAYGCDGSGFRLASAVEGHRPAAVCCTSCDNSGKGFDTGNVANEMIWSSYAAGNSGGDIVEGSATSWSAPSGWNAAGSANADLAGVAGDNYKNSIDLTDTELDADYLALEAISWNGDAGDRAGRNPYNDLTASYDFDDFFKNDTGGDALWKKDVAGNDRPTPDTADVAWDVGASEHIDPAAPPYDDGTASGGIVFGGEVVEVGVSSYTDPAASGGIVLGGPSTAATEPDEVHQVDGACTGGIVFGGEVDEQWTTDPNNSVAVKGGTYRISGTLYTLAETLTVTGLGSVAAIVNCGDAPAAAGTYRYDLLSIDSAGTITVTAGTEAATPVMPSTPANEIKLDHVLRYYGQSTIIQADIGKTYTAPQLTTLTAVVTDDELAWAELTTAITITCRDQYGQLYTGGKVVNASITTGNGTISPASQSGSASSFSFTYTRDQEVTDVSPVITFSSPTGPFCTAFIRLLDAAGDLMT